MKRDTVNLQAIEAAVARLLDPVGDLEAWQTNA
jgi:hypothetical protein